MTVDQKTKTPVLVVDDDPFMLKLLARYVEMSGYEVSTAVNGADALTKIREEGISIVVTDWQMPVMDGLELCKALRTQEGVDIAYVILVTAQTVSEEMFVQAFDAGIDDFLAKPIRSSELSVRIRAGSRIVDLQKDLERRTLDAHRVNAQVAIANEQLGDANAKLRYFATTDELTELTNRRAAMTRLEADWARGVRHGESVSCAMIDIDHFKAFNDMYGHATGDAVLKEVARVFRKHTRLGDECCRIGGEEFLLICPDSVEDDAYNAGERMRAAIESNVVVVDDQQHSVTISVGVAQRVASMTKVDDLIGAADAALYEAKDQGRNGVVRRSGMVDRKTSLEETDTAAADGTLIVQRQSLVAESAHVLVVDDDASCRSVFRRHLENAGFTVDVATNGLDALEKTREMAPDVVVMDVMMPELGGLESTRRLKADPLTSRIPVIIASGRADATNAEAAHEAGASEFIGKPVNGKELVLRVSSVARLKRELDMGLEVRGEQARAMAMLMDFTRRIAATESLDCILQSTIDVLSELTSCRRVAVMLPDDAGEYLTVADSRGLDEFLSLTIKVPVGERVAGEVFATGKALVVNSDDMVATGHHPDSDFFVSSPFACKPLRAAEHVVGVVSMTDRCGRDPFGDIEIEVMDLMCNVAAAAIHAYLTQQARDNAHESIVVALATLAEYRDDDTGKHLDRVTQYCVILAEELRSTELYASEIDDKFIAQLKRAVPLHDIGKVGIPDRVLLKPGRLTADEITIMRGHADIGAKAIRSVVERSPGVSFLRMAEEIARCHHEWFNGAGYPQGISGLAIPLSARITSVADVYDALTTRRVYKEAMPHDRAMTIIFENSGTQFDADIVAAFDRCQSQFIRLAEELCDTIPDAEAESAHESAIAAEMPPRDRVVQNS